MTPGLEIFDALRYDYIHFLQSGYRRSKKVLRAPFKLLTKDRTVHSIATAQDALQLKALVQTICLLKLSPEP